MYDPGKIVTWCAENFQSMRASRRKTLAALIGSAMKMQGTGVLALGRAMDGEAFAKHRIKRVDRFLGNEQVEVETVFSGLFALLRGTHTKPVVLADWTDRHEYEQLVLALSKNGRALPFLWVTVKKGEFEDVTTGLKIQAEDRALKLLKAICPARVTPVLIADRGFGHARWLAQIQKWGWYLVQRLAKNHQLETTGFIGVLHELGIRRAGDRGTGDGARWGRGRPDGCAW